jgi:hypothetical protein
MLPAARSLQQQLHSTLQLVHRYGALGWQLSGCHSNSTLRGLKFDRCSLLLLLAMLLLWILWRQRLIG